ncbi:MAG: hypothetical protein RJA70_3909 [Pseudomonadota bacterium]
MSDDDDALQRMREFARSRAKARVESMRVARFEEEARTRVIREDLAYLPQVKVLLSVLQDAYAAPQRLRELLEQIPVLRARCCLRAGMATDYDVLPSLKEALASIGNLGIEAELFGLLEDLTVLSAEQGPGQDPRSE